MSHRLVLGGMIWEFPLTKPSAMAQLVKGGFLHLFYFFLGIAVYSLFA